MSPIPERLVPPRRGWALPAARLLGLAVGLGLSLSLIFAFGQAGSKGVRVAEPAAVAASAPGSSEVQALQHRCNLAMIRGTCRVMNPAAAASDPAPRVFIAGAGEVDARVYAELRRQGDEMCSSVARQCQADWQGTACRIARSLYPA